ncbi:MAG: FAD-dependent monooxygenase [Waddliaceae bacterium]
MNISDLVQANQPDSQVVISGAGPAGLACALNCLKEGYSVSILEKRKEISPGRAQAVILDSKTVDILEEHNIYRYLLENHLVFPIRDNRLRVRLTDLEDALKIALKTYYPKVEIQYENSIREIEEKDEKIQLFLNDGTEIDQVDYLINAEGFRSRINEITQNRRETLLDQFPVIVSILKDDRPNIKSVKSFAEYVVKSMRNIACFTYYFSIYLFKALFCNEHFLSSKRHLSISQTLKTPGQHNVSLGFTKEKHEKFLQLVEEVERGQRPQKDLDSFVRFWTNIALCEVTAFSCLAKIAALFGVKEERFSAASYLPFENYNIVQIQSDQLQRPSITFGQSHLLNIGDALATVDPTTGLGCNQAIEHSKLVLKLLGRECDLRDYDTESKEIIDTMHKKALELRQFARPDLHP